MSHKAINCAHLATDMNTREFLYHVSIMLWPQNTDSIKSLGYALECFGHTSTARSVYLQCYLLTADFGCGLHLLLASPTLSQSEFRSMKVFRQSLSGLHQLLQLHFESGCDILQAVCGIDTIYNKYRSVMNVSHSKSSTVSLDTLFALPLNPQYLGQPPAIIYSLLSSVLTLYSPNLSFPLIQRLQYIQARREVFSAGKNIIRLGIVSGMLSDSIWLILLLTGSSFV